jgi:hypothetical protein
MSAWIALDVENIARRRIGRLASRTFTNWETNVPPTSANWTQYVYGPHYGSAEQVLAPILTGLAHNYRHAKLEEKQKAISSFLATIREFLDSHGLDFADGK